MKPSKLFSPGDRERIEEAVRQAESGTSGEIVVSVVESCARHAAAPWRMAVVLAGVALLASSWLPIGASVVELFVLQMVAVALAHVFGRVPTVRRAFVSEGECSTKAELAAMRAFHAHEIRRTTGRTGILIFVALFEHRVVVLGDEAVDRSLAPDEDWEEIVELVLNGLRTKHPTEGLVAAIVRCGERLARPLPAAHDDVDELPQGLFLLDD